MKHSRHYGRPGLQGRFFLSIREDFIEAAVQDKPHPRFDGFFLSIREDFIEASW